MLEFEAEDQRSIFTEIGLQSKSRSPSKKLPGCCSTILLRLEMASRHSSSTQVVIDMLPHFALLVDHDVEDLVANLTKLFTGAIPEGYVVPVCMSGGANHTGEEGIVLESNLETASKRSGCFLDSVWCDNGIIENKHAANILAADGLVDVRERMGEC